MSSFAARRRRSMLFFGGLALLFGLPLCAIIVFVMLLPSDNVMGNLAASIALALIPTVLTAGVAGLLMRLSPSKSTGILQGVASALLGFLLFFVVLGIWRGDVGGLLATGLYLLLTTKILWALPILAGILGFLLARRFRREQT